MKWSKEFQEFLVELSDDEYVGLGNPDAKILFVGKEAANNSGEGTKEKYMEGSNDYSKSFVPNSNILSERNLRNLNHTWQKYQKLYDRILYELSGEEIRDREKYKITFVENVFTTELSCLSAPNTSEAKKNPNFELRLGLRKDAFWSKNFISKQFPIILIFAKDKKYIETYEGEVVSLFGIPFRKHLNAKENNEMWLHYTDEGSECPRLLIHTRQLTNPEPSNLIKEIAEIVSEFIKENKIDIRVK